MEIQKASAESALAVKPAEQMRLATDVAGVCAEIVKKTALKIRGRQYVRVEGWQSIATAHGCIAGSRDVEQTETGIKAIGEVRRADTGTLIAQAEGFVGDDEQMWANRSEYARRAMAQTRAISRACRSAFAHVVVLIDSNLSTTPAEEMPEDESEHTFAKPGGSFREPSGEKSVTGKGMGFKQASKNALFGAKKPSDPVDWREVGDMKGRPLGELTEDQLNWYWHEWLPSRLEEGYKPATKVEEVLIGGLLEWKRQQLHAKPNPMTAKEFQEERERQQAETEADITDWNPAA
jgi:hypothetical protein